jgi:integrase
MPWVRKLPSGLWAATVRLPTGKKITRSFPLKGSADKWANSQVEGLRKGDWIDPRAGELSITDWYERCRDSRHLEKASRARDESHWRRHVEPQWADVPIGAVLKTDVSAWVVRMQQKDKLGAATIEAAVGVLRGLLEQAVDAKLIHANPVRGVSVPRRDAHVDRVLGPDEADALLDALERHNPKYPAARLMCELMLDTGMRWEEVAAVDTDHIEQRRKLIHVGPVMERDGTVRPYPKSPAGERPLPVGDDLWPQLWKLVGTAKRGGLLFTAPQGGSLLYPTWRSRVWLPAIHGRVEYIRRQGHKAKDAMPGAGLVDPQPTPHDLRHTYGTRLADAGVPPHEMMRLMGHEHLTSLERYLHAGEARFDNAREAIRKAKIPRQGTQSGSSKAAGSPAAHG